MKQNHILSVEQKTKLLPIGTSARDADLASLNYMTAMEVISVLKEKNTKSKRIALRVTPEEREKIQKLADKYTEGKISEYVLYAALHFKPKKKEDE